MKVIVTPVVRLAAVHLNTIHFLTMPLPGSSRRVHPQLYSSHRRRLIFELSEGLPSPSTQFHPLTLSLSPIQILDLKGTAKTEQNSLLDSFLTITSTKNELETTSFLSSLDMDPNANAQISSNMTSPTGSRVSLPLADGAGGASTPMGVGESLFAALGSPPLSGTGSGLGRGDDQKREVFSDFRRFVSGFRRDSTMPAP